MTRAIPFLVMLSASSCLLGHFSEQGALDTSVEIDRRVSDGDRVVTVEGRTAKVGFQRSTCIDTRYSFLVDRYEKRQYPADTISLITAGLGLAGLILGVVSQDGGFLWPESRPAITSIALVTAGISGGILGFAGLFPIVLGAGKPRDTLLRSERTTEFDRVKTRCTEQALTVTGQLPYRAWLYGAAVTATTPPSGELKVRRAVATALKGEKFTPQRLRHFEEDPDHYVTFELAGTEKQVELVKLYELRIHASSLQSLCIAACGAAGGAKRCGTRERVCREEGGGSLCAEMRNSCIESESPNRAGFEACFDSCVQERLVEIFK